MKRKSNEQSLGEVIQDYLRESGWQQKLEEIKIITEWDKLLGPTLAKYTDEVFIKNKQLHIRLKSATLRQELSYQKSGNKVVNKAFINYMEGKNERAY